MAPSSSAWVCDVSTATAQVGGGHGERDVGVPWADVFCTIMSTLIDLSASARNSRAATPGRSGTPLTVTLASDVSWVTAVTTASSMSASSSTTQVPGSQVKLLRTCSGTLWLRANSTARSIRTRPPVAAISSISSNEIRLMRCASGTIRGSAVKTPVTSV